ncbi:TonB-dependent receptor [Rhodanobacter sp. AS-Z3]|uniref:TonB-dependent receptor n=1 Tax=Rhodanobacter sp. AS-Z3 TaxID=3031330 RepID=UPI00247A59FB|nr:TonB-dependent receptor [Rhodanobacter sp. AS-Z3]WEN13579.1 TonB-dependent receptor [Rhodanobacter sp. AS-Z3]
MPATSVCAEIPQARSVSHSVPARQDQSGTTDQVTRQHQPVAGIEDQAHTMELGSVVVTANRRDETLQTVAAPVSVLTNRDIERQHLEDFADYAGTVPGLNYVSMGPGQTELSLRGIASGSAQPSASVGVYVDETPYGSSSVFATGSLTTPDLDPTDLERVEVLRGPQGTLYGAGALGGVIRFITIDPDTQSLSGRVQLEGNRVAGGGSGFSTHGMINLPLITDKMAVRATAFDRTDPGFIDDAGLGKRNVNDSRVKGGRVSLLWMPSEQTSLRLMTLAQNLNGDGSPSVTLHPLSNQPIYGDLQQRVAAKTGTFAGRYRLSNATLKSDFGWSSLTASSSYSTLDARSQPDDTPLLYLGPPTGTVQTNTVRQTKATQELRLQSPTDQTVEWLGGVFFTHETGSNLQHVFPINYATGVAVASPFGMPIADVSLPSTYDAYAAYASLTFHISERFDVEMGLRYSHDQQHFQEIGSGVLFGSAIPMVLVDKKSADSSNTYSLTPRFHISDTTMIYGRVASGFLPGGPNVVPAGIPGVPATFSPTRLVNYELGLKTTSADHRFTADLSAFYIDWTRIPLTTFINPYSFLTDAGKADSKGLEATIQFIPVQGVRLAFNSAYTHAKLTSAAPSPSNGKAGDRLPYSPQFTANVSADYDFPLSGGWKGFVGATYQFVGSRMTDFAFDGSARSTVPSYETLALRAGASHDQWDFHLYVKNLGNERGIVQGSGGAGRMNPVSGMNENKATIITPRQMGVSVSYSF